MRLINTTDFSLREVYEPGSDYPYAILSHTWDESLDDPQHREVTFQDIQTPERARMLSGWAKIEKTCELARAYDPPLRWAWIDTCCIDKSSSAELTEAINSMFRWYQQSTVCFAFLSDMPPAKPMSPMQGTSAQYQFHDSLPHCRWFTRGWTLQELLAPKTLDFYDSDWVRRGDKGSMTSELSRITKIDEQALKDQRTMFQVPVGRRMSWASSRSTKRVEDMAYCLLGIFDLNIPLIYGEGENAFARLQEALVRQSVDLSLFAWDSFGPMSFQAFHGMFATSPKQFANCHGRMTMQDAAYAEDQSLGMTNRGLELVTYLRSDLSSFQSDRYVAHLNCFISIERPGSSTVRRGLGVRLVRTYKGFARCHPDGLCLVDLSRIYGSVVTPIGTAPDRIFIPPSLSPLESDLLGMRLKDSIRFRVVQPPHASVVLTCTLSLISGSDRRAWEKDKPVLYTWDRVRRTFMTDSEERFIGILHPKIESYIARNIHWPRGLRILCGFFEGGRSNLAKLVGVTSEGRKPYAYLIAIASEKDAGISIHGTPFRLRDIALLMDDLDALIDSGTSYGSALVTMRERLLEENHYFASHPNEELNYTLALDQATIRLTPYQLGLPDAAGNPQKKWLQDETVNLTLSIKDVDLGSFNGYEATLRFDPAAGVDSGRDGVPGPDWNLLP
ncbi:heterokaryon incompatibility protein-domain-containing protein [Cercophora scortea]|uniref:Heterokaryon incompatibility protein-domain-containing protein n=1 Tax=Cercophora scortea TaxID=314031 RepID=A0AAE0M526_9PEZI|nr:heterokaryon incompatibility protein-domain-containing protein [Cercophora scortea]